MNIQKVMCMMVALLSMGSMLHAQNDNSAPMKLPPQLRMVRVFGGNDERLPPIAMLSIPTRKSSILPTFGEKSVTIELDVQSDLPPSFYATFVHCATDWSEDNNVFLNQITFRTSNIDWKSAPVYSRYYTYRGSLSVPNSQVNFKVGGNWKAKFYDYNDDNKMLAEARFFIVDPAAECFVDVYGDLYEPTMKVSPAAFTIETQIQTLRAVMDNQVQTAVVYRNNRWNEPIVISQIGSLEEANNYHKYPVRTQVSGFGSIGKRFRVDKIPAENDYRIIDMNNLGYFPRINGPIRPPFADLRRNGTFFDRADDGILTTRFTALSDDEYVQIEFILDPESRPSERDVFIAGSFNSWTPDRSWMMYYDEKDRLYKLRQWVRRGRHNYLYGTGNYNADTQKFDSMSYEEFEGNTRATPHSFISLIYYREFEYGGYDTIIGVGAGNSFGRISR
ncbi:MAG: DUF5103 domain-containing protein [Ignavibacteria bacterium]|nr:DUF5103 domain-containing protein [Ignavibacteria bacterium]